MKKLSHLKKTGFILLALLILTMIFCLAVSFYMRAVTKDRIVSLDDARDFECDFILVLGARVYKDSPSLMLADRIKRGADVYFAKENAKMLMSGDHSRPDYNEVEVMKNYAISLGVKEEDIFLDHEGYSTSESVLNLSKLDAKRVIIVTQRYHLPRALFLADRLNIDAVGIEAENILYKGHEKRLVREILAQTKDFLASLFFTSTNT